MGRRLGEHGSRIRKGDEMPKIRAEFKGKYAMDKHEFYTAYHFALQYPKWLDKYNALGDTSKAIRYDQERVQTSVAAGSSVEDAAIERAEIRHRLDMIEETAKEVNSCFSEYLIKAVTNEHVTYKYLASVMLIPCSKNLYYDMRREFYYRLSKKISKF